MINPGETVFIKANFCTAGFLPVDGVATGSCTKPDIVVAVAEECLRVGAGKVIIGDGGQARTFSWEELHTVDGSTNLLAEAARLNATYSDRLQLACLVGDSPWWDALPSPYTNLGEIRVSSLVTQADKIISVPVLKTHMMTQMTGSLKNFVGVTSTDDYGYGTPSRMKLHNAAGGHRAVLPRRRQRHPAAFRYHRCLHLRRRERADDHPRRDRGHGRHEGPAGQLAAAGRHRPARGRRDGDLA